MFKNLVVYLYLVAAGQGFFLTLLIAFSSKFRNRTLANLTALLTGLFSYNIFYFFSTETELIRKIPHILGTQIPLIALYGPLLWLIFRIMVRQDFRWKWIYVMHLLPFLLLVLFFTDSVYSQTAARKMYFHAKDAAARGDYPFMWEPFLITYLRAIHLGVYIFLCYRELRRASYTLTMPLMAAPVAFAVLFFIYSNIAYIGITDTSYLAYTVKLTLAVSLYAIAYIIYRNGGTIEPAPVKVKYQTSGLDSDTARLLSERVLAELEKPEIYLDATTSLKKLSEKMNYPPQYISQSVNEHFRMGFPDLLNKLRVEHAKKLLAGSNDKIISIAYSSGFNNKVSFINAFKKYTNTTPLAFRNAAVKE